MHYVLTRTMLFRFEAKNLTEAKKLIEGVDLVQECDIEDVLTCEDNGNEVLL